MLLYDVASSKRGSLLALLCVGDYWNLAVFPDWYEERVYKGNEAYAVSEGLMQHLFPLLSCVLQGGPLSGTLSSLLLIPYFGLLGVI